MRPHKRSAVTRAMDQAAMLVYSGSAGRPMP